MFVFSNIHVISMVELRLRIGERRTGYQSCSSMARIQTIRYRALHELSPTGSETSGADRQSEIVAAINGPICCGLEAKKRLRIGERRWAICQGERAACTGYQSCSSMARIQTSGTVRYTNSHRTVQKLPALIGNPRSSQQLMGQFVVA